VGQDSADDIGSADGIGSADDIGSADGIWAEGSGDRKNVEARFSALVRTDPPIQWVPRPLLWR